MKENKQKNVIIEDLEQTMQRAERGDQSVLPALREILNAHSEIWQLCGDLALQARTALIALAAGDNLLLAESLERKMDAFKADLIDEHATPLEKMLAERVALSWLELSYFDVLASQSCELSRVERNLIKREQDRAHRRYLTGMKMLVTVQQLLPKKASFSSEKGLSLTSGLESVSSLP